jgi:hypothetical protein
MKALLKTLFGDWGVVAAVTVIMIAEVLFVTYGQVALAKFAIPWLVLAATGWLATR